MALSAFFCLSLPTMKYIEVILPLPLDGLFTYAVEDALVDKVDIGVRVSVPLGKSKTYIGVATCTPHDLTPDQMVDAKGKTIEFKKILSVMDSKPVLLPQQMKLWQWIADYYLCPIGDILKAALPAGMKAEDGYRPKTELYIGLTPQFQHEQSLNIALDVLKRATKQQKAFIDFLALSHWDSLVGDNATEDIVEITRDELLNTSHTTMPVIKQLISKKMLFTYEKEVSRINSVDVSMLPDLATMQAHSKSLSEAQDEAYNQILMQMMHKNVVLLHGVTSSGKTEIYIHLIQKAISEHKQVLYLLPEIALTVQIMERLRGVFGNRLGIYHSKYSDAERVEIWQKQLSDNPYDVILGARSACFLPFQNLGLVIIDEEHETSFKQQDPAPRYHARSAAIVLAQMYGAKTLLGTATPSMESAYNAQQGKYGIVSLTTRYKGIKLPAIEVVDIKDLRRRKMMNGPFSPDLLAAVRTALANGEQVILFQNRRGFAPMIECPVCGWVPKCKNCDVSLTYHKNLNQMSCHYCGYTYPVPDVCPNCGSNEIRGKGYGTEKIEDLLRDIFPEAHVARMDLDTTRSRNAYERIIDDFATGRTNVLIGTQMISKGLDFDKVSVVGILDADTMLNYPDFRSFEHAFMMMSQVSGRAGRKGKQGKVILQTKSPELPVIQQVVRHDFRSFYKGLLEERSFFHYPPFYHLIYVNLKHRREEVVESAALELGARLRQYFGTRVLGPDKPSVARVMSLNIRKIVLKLENGLSGKQIRATLRYVQSQLLQDKRYATLQIFYDVDPL